MWSTGDTGQRTHPDGLKVKSRVQVGLSPTPTLHPFWRNFRMGGYTGVALSLTSVHEKGDVSGVANRRYIRG